MAYDETNAVYATATLNDKIMPVDRGEVYEDPLDDFLAEEELGETSGGGTMQEANGEIEYVDVEITFDGMPTDEQIAAVVAKLEEFGAPKGSRLTIHPDEDDENGEGRVVEFGRREGLAIYLDGVNLPDEVYDECDVNDVVAVLSELTGDDSEFVRHWTGEEETGIYFYSDKSFDEMSAAIADFVAEYPLCRNARIVRIA